MMCTCKYTSGNKRSERTQKVYSSQIPGTNVSSRPRLFEHFINQRLDMPNLSGWVLLEEEKRSPKQTSAQNLSEQTTEKLLDLLYKLVKNDGINKCLCQMLNFDLANRISGYLKQMNLCDLSTCTCGWIAPKLKRVAVTDRFPLNLIEVSSFQVRLNHDWLIKLLQHDTWKHCSFL